MGHNKTNGHTAPLDARIALTLASAKVNKDELVSLLEEAHEALVAVQAVIEAETPRLHDLSNTNPDGSLDLINRSKLRVERLELAIPKLRNRIKSIELYEYAQRYHERGDMLAAERDELAVELAKIYEPFLAQITNLYARIDHNTAAIAALHRSAPAGENRRLLDAELVARGIDRYDAVHPRLREQLKLPEFIRASVIAYPPDHTAMWNERAVQMNAALAKRMAEKGALATGDNWHAGRDLQIEQEEFEFAKRAAELKAKETADKVAYEQRLQEAERRRLGGIK